MGARRAPDIGAGGRRGGRQRRGDRVTGAAAALWDRPRRRAAGAGDRRHRRPFRRGGATSTTICSPPSIWAAEKEIVPPSRRACRPIQTHLWWRSRLRDLPGPDTQPIHFSVPLYEPWMGGSAQRVHAIGRDCPPAEPGVDPAERPVGGRHAAHRSSDLHLGRGRPRLRSRPRWPPGPASRWAGRPRRCRNGARASSIPVPRSATPPRAARDYVRRTAISYHHQVGTCRMGVDERGGGGPRACACTGWRD